MCLRLGRLALKSELLLSPDAPSALREARARNNLAATERNNPRLFQRGASVPRSKVFRVLNPTDSGQMWQATSGNQKKVMTMTPVLPFFLRSLCRSSVYSCMRTNTSKHERTPLTVNVTSGIIRPVHAGGSYTTLPAGQTTEGVL